jgi:hypothetical protein
MKIFPDTQFHIFKEYLKRTQSLRAGNSNQLFIVTIDPFDPASKATIARWMVYVIVQSCEMAGVPVRGKVKAH